MCATEQKETNKSFQLLFVCDKLRQTYSALALWRVLQPTGVGWVVGVNHSLVRWLDSHSDSGGQTKREAEVDCGQ